MGRKQIFQRNIGEESCATTVRSMWKDLIADADALVGEPMKNNENRGLENGLSGGSNHSTTAPYLVDLKESFTRATKDSLWKDIVSKKKSLRYLLRSETLVG